MKKILLLPLICITLGLSACSSDYIADFSFADNRDVSLCLIGDEHVHILGQALQATTRGGSVSFSLVFDDQFIYSSNDGGGAYSDQKVTFANVSQPGTYHVFSKPLSGIHIQIENNDEYGYLTTNLSGNDDYVEAGTIVNISVTANAGYEFTDWTEDFPDSKTIPLNFERTFTFPAEKDVILFANYFNPKNENSIHYVGNGGKTKSGDSDIYYNHTINNHLRINTAQGEKMFFREGYLLESWNTESDGSGKRIGLGSRVSPAVPGSELVLYAIWEKESAIESFSFSENESGFSVSSCTCTDQVITVPHFFKGKPITTIKNGSFGALPVERINLPSSVVTVEDNSFSQCLSLTTLLFSDSLEIINNAAVLDKNLDKIFINSFANPKFGGDTYQAIWPDKVDLLLSKRSKKLINIGNSNTTRSIVSEDLEKAFGLDVITLGVQESIGVVTEIDTLNYLCKNDENIIVFSPEFGAMTYSKSFTYLFFLAVESNYDLLAILDLKGRYFNVLSAYSKFVEQKQTISSINPPYLPGYINNGMNTSGQIYTTVTNRHEESWYFSLFQIDYSFYSQEKSKWINQLPQLFPNSKIFYSSCSFNLNSIPSEERSLFYGSYQESIRSSITAFPVISSLSDYGFNGSFFWNDNYHLIKEGAVLRTSRLIKDLQSYL